MSANTILNAGTGGDTIQTIDNTTYKTQVVAIGNSTGANIAAVNATGQVSILSPDQTATGSLTATGSVTLTANGGGDTAMVQVTGTWVGTLVFEGSVDGANFYTLPGQVPSSGALITSTTAVGVWAIDIAGSAVFRVRCSAQILWVRSVSTKPLWAQPMQLL